MYIVIVRNKFSLDLTLKDFFLSGSGWAWIVQKQSSKPEFLVFFRAPPARVPRNRPLCQWLGRYSEAPAKKSTLGRYPGAEANIFRRPSVAQKRSKKIFTHLNIVFQRSAKNLEQISFKHAFESCRGSKENLKLGKSCWLNLSICRMVNMFSNCRHYFWSQFKGSVWCLTI